MSFITPAFFWAGAALIGIPLIIHFLNRRRFKLVQWAAMLSVFGLLLSAIFLLTLIQRVFNGPVPVKWAAFPDLNGRELLAIAPVMALLFVIGIFPQTILHFINRTAVQLVSQLVY